MARDQFLEACSRELFVHLKPKAFENLDAMSKEADLFAEARGGAFSCVNKGQRDSNKGAAQSKPESKPSGKPEIKCGICGKGHLTIRCYKNPDRKQAYSAKVASGSKGSNSDYGGENEQGTQIKSEENESSKGRGNTRFFRGRGKTDDAPRGGGHQMSLETDRESKLSSEIVLEKLKHSFEMKHLELMGQLEVQRASFKTELEKQKSEKLAHARDPKLPYFEESKDKMDSYLSRFEKYETANK